MMRWLMLAVRGVVVLIAVVCIASVTARPLVGQQVADSAPQVADSVVPVSAPVAPATSAGTALPGPRVRPDYARVEPAFAESNASSSAVAGSHTITITTLALVLLIIIIVLLVAD